MWANKQKLDSWWCIQGLQCSYSSNMRRLSTPRVTLQLTFTSSKIQPHVEATAATETLHAENKNCDWLLGFSPTCFWCLWRLLRVNTLRKLKKVKSKPTLVVYHLGWSVKSSYLTTVWSRLMSSTMWPLYVWSVTFQPCIFQIWEMTFILVRFLLVWRSQTGTCTYRVWAVGQNVMSLPLMGEATATRQFSRPHLWSWLWITWKCSHVTFVQSCNIPVRI